MIPLVQREVIDKGWVKEDEFWNCSRWRSRLPDRRTNTAVYLSGSTRCMATGDAARRRDGNYPARFLIILRTDCDIFQFDSREQMRVVEAVFKGIRPAVVALMLAPVFGFSKGLGWTGILAVPAAFVVVFAVSPVYMIIVVGATGGIAFGWLKLRRSLRIFVKDSPAQAHYRS